MTENGAKERTPRIGVYLCHCGSNIAGMVNIPEVSEFATELDNVTLVRDYRFMCSEPGQELIAKDINEQGLERVVVAACSPLMHEKTFREAVEEADLNRYLMQMANVREHCSWVTADGSYATEKAKALVAAAVGKAVWLEPLEPGIQAALTIAEAGKKVYLVERSPTLGGHMSHFDKTFPTLDCAACILTPKMVAVGKHPNVELLTWSEIEEVSGYIGNFTIKIRKKQRFVDMDRCNGCGDCWEECPSTTSPRKRRITIEGRLINERVL